METYPRPAGGNVTRAAWLSSCLLLAPWVMAQSTGTLRMAVDPHVGHAYVLDHEFRMNKPELELTAGPHHFSFWAPQRKLVDTTLIVVAGKVTSFQLRLPYSTEYLVYQRDLKAYQKDMGLMRTLPAMVTGGAMVYAVFSYSAMQKAHAQLEKDRGLYDIGASPQAITVLKDETMATHKEDFRKARSGFIISSGATALLACTTAWLYLHSAKKPQPVFRDAEKVRFDGLSWMPGPDGGSWQGGITWNLTR
ncbi:MAG: hypothetical protein KBH07_13580 [Flavobacteriales bacterium]|nr:hypothetical protein [Flavobacteriales bacterium]MBP9081324.1 hypothetical protein [Flavobacteriales bacterium]